MLSASFLRLLDIPYQHNITPMDLSFFRSKIFKAALIAIGITALLLLSFKAGEFVGYKKARFSYRWAENYHQNFGGPRDGFMRGPIGKFMPEHMESFMRDVAGKDYMNAHGITGAILKIDGDTMIIQGQDDIEKTVLISDNTIIKKHRETIAFGDLKVNDTIVIIGSPNDQGQIESKLIRIFN